MSVLLLGEALIIQIGNQEKMIIEHMTASFGEQKYEVSGGLKIPTEAEMGCERFRESATINGTVLLVKRGECKFVDKAKFAQDAGAKALIIGDLYTNDRLVKMISPLHVDIDIPVVFIKGKDHDHLRKLLKANGNANMEAILNTIGEQYLPDYEGSHEQNIQLPLIFLILMSALPLSWFLFRGIDRIRRCVRDKINQQRFVNYASTLPVQEFKVDEAETKERICINSTCVICLEDFKDGEGIKVLPCDHGFHTQCIMPWFERSGNCPVCKMHYNQLHSLTLKEMCSGLCCDGMGLNLYTRLRNPTEEDQGAPEDTPMGEISRDEGDAQDARVCIGEVMTPQGFREESKAGPLDNV